MAGLERISFGPPVETAGFDGVRREVRLARQRRRHASVRAVVLGVTLLLALLFLLGATPSRAEGTERQQMKGLDEQVQEIKSDVLSIDAELRRLEEKLLYPSITHVALFVALAKGESMRLDAVQVQLDGKLVAHYIYSFKEIEALQKGGVQRLYTGNIPTGAHQLEVSVMGKLEGGKEYAQTESFTIDKGVEPKLVGITLSGPGSARAITVGDW